MGPSAYAVVSASAGGSGRGVRRGPEGGVLAGWFQYRRPRGTAMWRHTPAAVGDERRQQPHDRRDQRRHDFPHHERDHSRTDHDDDQTEGGERCQTRPDPQEAGEDQAGGAEPPRGTDEPKDRPWQRDRPRQLLKWQHELHAACEQEDGGEQALNDPQRYGHRRALRSPFPLPDEASFSLPDTTWARDSGRPLSSRTGRTSTVPRRAIGMRAAMAMASSRSAASIRKKPPSCSRVSANGPSVTSRLPSRMRTLAADAVGSSGDAAR